LQPINSTLSLTAVQVYIDQLHENPDLQRTAMVTLVWWMVAESHMTASAMNAFVARMVKKLKPPVSKEIT